MATVNLGRVVGKSAYELWLEADNAGTMEDYLASLKGDPGDVNVGQMNAAISDAIAPITSQLDATADNAALWRTATGNPASFYPVPKSRLYPKIELVATQSGSGDPSPENIRPIVPSLLTGQKVKAKRTGKNLFDKATNTALALYFNGNVISMGTNGRIVYIPCLPDAKYTVSKLPASTFVVGCTESMPDRVVPLITTVTGNTLAALTITTPANARYLVVYFYVVGTDVPTQQAVIDSIQIEYGSTATPYEPYSGADYDLLTAEQDFYGLPDAPVVVDAEAGTVVVQDAVLVLDGVSAGRKMSQKNADNGEYKSFFLQAADIGKLAGSNMDRCTNMPSISWSSDPAQTCWWYANTTSGMRIHKSLMPGYDDLTTDAQRIAAANTYLAAQYAAGTPVTIQYKLATPVTIPITPPVIAALERLKRTEARQNVLTVTANDSTVGVQKQTVTYAKSPIRESDEIAAAIAALA